LSRFHQVVEFGRSPEHPFHFVRRADSDEALTSLGLEVQAHEASPTSRIHPPREYDSMPVIFDLREHSRLQQGLVPERIGSRTDAVPSSE